MTTRRNTFNSDRPQIPGATRLPESSAMNAGRPTLFTMPGTCALSVHIALKWTGADYALQVMKRGANREPSFLAMNPAGQVPTVKLEDGRVLTEAHAILLWVADSRPESGLAPSSVDALARYELEEALAFMTGEVHGAFVPMFVPGRFLDDEAQAGAVKDAAARRVRPMLERLDARVGDKDFLLGTRTVADPFLYVLTRWAGMLDGGLTAMPNLARFRTAMEADPAVAAALTEQGMQPAGDAH